MKSADEILIIKNITAHAPEEKGWKEKEKNPDRCGKPPGSADKEIFSCVKLMTAT